MGEQDVAIVAAGNAWPFYRLAAAYVCQPNRTFQKAKYLGFYSQHTIHGVAARIEHVEDGVTLSQAVAARMALSTDPRQQRIGNVIAAALTGPWKEGEQARVLLLSPLDHPSTERFTAITHPRPAAWTMKQRYSTVSALRSATTTDDL